MSSSSSSSSSPSPSTSSPSVVKSLFELDIPSKEEQTKLSSAFLGSLPLLQPAEYQGNVVLISGANKGLGYEVARTLGSKGLKVLVGCRDAERGKEAELKLQQQEKNGSFQFVQLDVTSAESIAAAVNTVSALHGHLDVLINSAGILGDYAPPSQVDGDKLRSIYETNVFAPMLLTKAFLPLLEKSAHARIVNVSSGLGSNDAHSRSDIAYDAINAVSYCSSKGALNSYTVLLAKELRKKNSVIRVNAIDPGYTATDLNGNSGPQSLAEGSQAIVASSLLATNGPTGAFFNRFGYVAW